MPSVYDVIGEPLLFGAIQLNVTLTFVLMTVVGAAITSGIAAALIDTSFEFSPKPTRVRA